MRILRSVLYWIAIYVCAVVFAALVLYGALIATGLLVGLLIP